MMKSRIFYSALCLIVVMLLLVIARPRVMFSVDGTPKEFGLEEHQTMYSLGFVSIVSAIVLFYFFSLMDLIFS
jgi:hypothetical protein